MPAKRLQTVQRWPRTDARRNRDRILEVAKETFARPVQVNVVGLQSLQTGFHGLPHALAMIARSIWIIA
jgi:hypothetical protein